jgi:hypothetical protein
MWKAQLLSRGSVTELGLFETEEAAAREFEPAFVQHECMTSGGLAGGYDRAVLRVNAKRVEQLPLNFADSHVSSTPILRFELCELEDVLQLSESEHGEECEVCDEGGE